jgi:hypothetical protein
MPYLTSLTFLPVGADLLKNEAKTAMRHLISIDGVKDEIESLLKKKMEYLAIGIDMTSRISHCLDNFVAE